MIEESGQVIAVEGDCIVVQTQPRSTCSSCHVSTSCGTSVLSRWFGQRSNQLRVRNDLQLRVGERVVIGIQESALLKASLVAYLVPMLAMVAAAAIAGSQGAGDGAVALWSMAGLGIGLLMGAKHRHGSYQPALLRQESVHKPSFAIEIQRGKTS